MNGRLFNLSRLFAWLNGWIVLAWLFAYNAFPPLRIPITNHGEAEFPERFDLVGGLADYREVFSITIVSLFAAWVVAALLARVVRALKPKAEVSIAYGALVVSPDPKWIHLRDERIPIEDIASVATDGSSVLQVRLRTGRVFSVTTPEATTLAGKLREMIVGTSEHPAGLWWHGVRGGTGLRWLAAIGGFSMLIPLCVSAAKGFASGAHALTPVFALAFTAWMVLGVVGSSSMSVVIGRDGVRIRRAFGDRFVPYRQLRRVTVEGRVLYLHLEGGGNVRVSSKNASEMAARIQARHREALEDVGPTLSDEQRQRLRQGEQDAATWKAGLSGVATEQDYRKETWRVADLIDMAEAASAAPDTRVGAALALPDDDSLRERLRIAAADCADRDTRAALEAAAEGELHEEALAKAVARFELD